MNSQAVMVGVLLDGRPEELGGWLADARAFEAAGAGSLWVEPVAESALDPLALLAALAALTSRSLLVAALPEPGYPPEALARTLGTIRRLSHGRLAVVVDPERLQEVAVLAPGLGTFRRLRGEAGAFERTRGRDEPGGEDEPGGADEPERWVRTSPPAGRAAWRAALADATQRGAHGLLVPAGPRLLDILRNPDDPGDRRDLQLAQG